MNKQRYRELERVFRGVANYRRVQVIDILAREPELSVTDIAERTSIDFRTASEHLRKLVLAGLVMKYNHAATVRHALTEKGKTMLKFCRTLE